MNFMNVWGFHHQCVLRFFCVAGPSCREGERFGRAKFCHTRWCSALAAAASSASDCEAYLLPVGRVDLEESNCSPCRSVAVIVHTPEYNCEPLSRVTS